MDIGGSASGVADRGGITLLSLPGKVYSGVLAKRVVRFESDTLTWILVGGMEFAQPHHMCFVGLEKALDPGSRDLVACSNEPCTPYSSSTHY